MYKTAALQKKVIDSCTVGQVACVLMLGSKRMRKVFGDKWIQSQVVSKTGTTNDSRTCWYVGSTPRITTVVWIGCDDNRSLGKNVFPFATALPIWLKFNKAIEKEGESFSFDPSLKPITINEYTGLPTSSTHEDAITILSRA